MSVERGCSCEYRADSYGNRPTLYGEAESPYFVEFVLENLIFIRKALDYQLVSVFLVAILFGSHNVASLESVYTI